MNPIQKSSLLVKELGLPQLAEYLLYKGSLKFGIVASQTPSKGWAPDFNPSAINLSLPWLACSPNEKTVPDRKILLAGNEILAGNYRPFGGDAQPLRFIRPQKPLLHWTAYGDTVEGVDIKWVWEPARFAWAFDLAEYYLSTHDEKAPEFFWLKFSEFVAENPANLGPNWVSAQESALRIITWLMVYQVFKDAEVTTPQRTQQLTLTLWQHAMRIPPTLAYARSQHNNHHLSETLGLLLAGVVFQDISKRAKGWNDLGLREFEQGLCSQIEPDGTYSQHSANYHRLMLHLALIFHAYAQFSDRVVPIKVRERLAAATRWVGAQLDPVTGRLPNLGHNDGSLLLPLGVAEFRDYRPTLQAASRAFLGSPCLPPGPWDRLSEWLESKKTAESRVDNSTSPAVHKMEIDGVRACLRGVRFHGRPAHADQLHLDLWWDGQNIAQDPGTFAYNATPPWNNPLDATRAHNTLTIDDRDQMTKTGKFLWLGQAQADWETSSSATRLIASHNGYQGLGIKHHRSVEFLTTNHLQVIDNALLNQNRKSHLVTLHWLLPNWHWKLSNNTLLLKHENRNLELSVAASDLKTGEFLQPLDMSCIVGGETLTGTCSDPVLGWVADTYGQKHPALSISLKFQIIDSIQIKSDWRFSKRDAED